MSNDSESIIIYIINLYQQSPIWRKVQIFSAAGILGFFSVVVYLFYTGKAEVYYQSLTGADGNQITLLLTSTLILFFSFFVSSVTELNWANKFYSDLIPDPELINVFISIAIGIFLALLCYFTSNIKFFALMYFAFTLIDFISVIVYLELIIEKIESANESKYNRKMFREAKRFYMGRPWRKFALFKLFLTLTGLILVYKLNSSYYFYLYAAYSAIIIINEIIFWYWRYVLYSNHNYMFRKSEVI